MKIKIQTTTLTSSIGLEKWAPNPFYRLPGLRWLLLIACISILYGCGTTNKGGGYYQNDGPGNVTALSEAQLRDAVPRVDPLLSGPNKPYQVQGKRYVPDTREIPFKQRGHASWYGKQFHGRKTSSGEVYNMYAMTAAHPTLPIPCYVRVTNVSNNKSVIVRVNDRGPFLSKRIIDLSYAAAYKLDYIRKGTAEVIVERIMPDDIRSGTVASTHTSNNTSTNAQPDKTTEPNTSKGSAGNSWKTDDLTNGYYLQVATFSTLDRAQSVVSGLTRSVTGINAITQIQQHGNLHRIYVGPFQREADARDAAEQIRQYIGESPLLLDRR